MYDTTMMFFSSYLFFKIIMNYNYLINLFSLLIFKYEVLPKEKKEETFDKVSSKN